MSPAVRLFCRSYEEVSAGLWSERINRCKTIAVGQPRIELSTRPESTWALPMSFLLSLLDVVAAEILTCWLALSDITRLDSAACCGVERQDERRAMLACLYSRTTVYKTGNLLEDFNHRMADGFTRWLFSRNVHVTGIYISRTFLRDHDQRTLYLQRCGKSIKTIHAEEMHPTNSHPPTPTESLCRLCPNVVDITCPHDFTLSDYRAVAQAWTKLTSIVFPAGACAEALSLIARGCRLLRHVKLKKSLSKKATAQFILELPSTVETVELGDALSVATDRNNESSQAVSPTAVFQMANLPRLCHMTGQFMREQTDETLLALAQRCNLQNFEICGSDRVTEAAYATLSQYCKLQDVCITNGDRIAQKDIISLLQGCAPTLRRFSIEDGCTTEVVLALGKYCSLLEELCVDDTWNSPAIEGWEELAHGCSKLEMLTVVGGLLSEGGLCAIVERCRKLRAIAVNGSVVTDRAVFAIAQHCAHLRSLEITTTGAVSDYCLCELAKACPRLQVLLLGASFSDTTLFALAEHCVDLRGVSFSSPNVRDIEVTDEGVSALVTKCPKLREINFDRTVITDAIIPVIERSCKLLRRLRVADCAAVNEHRAGEFQTLLSRDVLLKIKFNGKNFVH